MNEIKIAKDLVRFASVTPLDKGAINYVAKSLKKLGFRFVPNGQVRKGSFIGKGVIIMPC